MGVSGSVVAAEHGPRKEMPMASCIRFITDGSDDFGLAMSLFRRRSVEFTIAESHAPQEAGVSHATNSKARAFRFLDASESARVHALFREHWPVAEYGGPYAEIEVAGIWKFRAYYSPRTRQGLVFEFAETRKRRY
jgi:hypothetical protein